MADARPERDPVARQRLDRWLFFVRMIKSRSLAQKAIGAGDVRVNDVRVTSASFQVKAGDVVAVALARRAVVLRVVSCGTRRGPYEEARLLYEDVTPEPEPDDNSASVHAGRERGAGRPEKKDRRDIARLMAPAWWQDGD